MVTPRLPCRRRIQAVRPPGARRRRRLRRRRRPRDCRTPSSSPSTATRSTRREVGGPKDHEVQAKDMNEAQALIDARMAGKVFVTAGPHDVGFTWKERPSQRQDVWHPAQRDSQEVHMIGGLPRLKIVGVEGPYNVKGVSASSPSRERIFVCRPSVGRRRNGLRREDLHQPDAARLSASGDGGGRRGADDVLHAGARRAAATSTPASAPASRACSPARRSSTGSSAIAPACAPAQRIRSATSSWRRACRSSSGAASPTTRC